MAKRGSKTFFEAFRPRGRSWQNEQSSAGEGAATAKFRRVPTALTQEETRFRSARPLTRLSTARTRMILIGAAAVAVVVVAVVLAIALRKPKVDSQPRGNRSSVSNPIPPAGARTAVVPPAPTRTTTDVHRLIIISGISEESARDLQSFLTKLGYVPTPFKVSAGWAIRVGEFDSPDSPAAKAFQQKFQNMEYKGKKQFGSCYYFKSRKE